MTENQSIKEPEGVALRYEHLPFQKRRSTKPVEIQLKLVTSDFETPRNIKSVTLTLSSLDEAWHIFEDLTHMAWEKIIEKPA
ncbi:MAG: hypothetical protein GXO96_00905 [Nitrospirae bacterium]|nr:hypothetical protein [Candidatus Manganitrophaceae bacterium]